MCDIQSSAYCCELGDWNRLRVSLRDVTGLREMSWRRYSWFLLARVWFGMRSAHRRGCWACDLSEFGRMDGHQWSCIKRRVNTLGCCRIVITQRVLTWLGSSTSTEVLLNPIEVTFFLLSELHAKLPPAAKCKTLAKEGSTKIWDLIIAVQCIMVNCQLLEVWHTLIAFQRFFY